MIGLFIDKTRSKIPECGRLIQQVMVYLYSLIHTFGYAYRIIWLPERISLCGGVNIHGDGQPDLAGNTYIHQ